MLQRFDDRGGHWSLLLVVWAAVTLPNLGAPGLWDIDEGNNAQAAAEMRESGNPVVPTFNYQLRVDKPALLYWLQMACYSAFGVNEFAARLPSALASLVAILLTYELGRRTFGSRAGLLAGVVLATATLFCAAARFANPDALLDAFTVLTLFLFWRGYRRGGPLPFGTTGAACGFAMLAKGPVGLLLPSAVAISFLLWQREGRRILDWRWVWGVLMFLLVAAPWYAWVGAETKFQWLRGFFWTHNVERVARSMENHSGPFFYYAVVLLVGFAPWSIFLGPAARNAWSEAKLDSDGRPHAATRFLLCWIAVYLLFFTLVRTKLPNYILPVYPAIALLTARCLQRWRQGLLDLPAWLLHASLACLALIGVGLAVGLCLVSGSIGSVVPVHRQLPGLEWLAFLGAIPVVGAAVGWRYLSRGKRDAVVASVAVASVAFAAALAAWGPIAVDRHKAPRPLAAALPADQTTREVRVAAFDYFQPSLVFYCQREVSRLATETQVLDFLSGPLPSFLFLPAERWDALRDKAAARELARHYDLYDGRDVVLISNGR